VSLLTGLFLILLWSAAAASADISPAAKLEITHLLEYLETSGCQFCRNGTWYDNMKAIREHAEMKYRYFVNKGRIHSAEDFIQWAASRSELSGKPYLVRCGNGSTEPTAQWLNEELDRYRKNKLPAPSK
jgi:hypothetical protein